jgi:hypothetical protein
MDNYATTVVGFTSEDFNLRAPPRRTAAWTVVKREH